MPLHVLFESPTVEELAAKIAARRGPDKPVLLPLVAVDRANLLPLSFAQQRLWFIDQLEPGSSKYNIPCAWRLSGEVTVDRLQYVFNELVNRHEILRTSFQLVHGEVRQIIASPARSRCRW